MPFLTRCPLAIRYFHASPRWKVFFQVLVGLELSSVGLLRTGRVRGGTLSTHNNEV